MTMDPQGRLRRSLAFSGIDEPTRSVTVLASSADLDADGSIVEQDWNLQRFQKNPVVLWAHEGGALPIGKAEDIQKTSEGLRMRIVLASERFNPFAEQVWQGIREGMVRGVSVAFASADVRSEERDGRKVEVLRGNELHEVSLLPVPSNPRALTDDEKQQLRSKAARLLATRKDEQYEEEPRVTRLDFGKLSKARRTPQGGLVAPAYLTRAGIFEYTRPDGRKVRELRPPEEVFHPASLATLPNAPVTDLHPPEMVRTDNWQKLAVGHVAEAVRQDGDFISAELVIQDARAVEHVEAGDRVELSCGYTCRLDSSPGEWNGRAYDLVQRDIRYNHVALGPKHWGRAGSDVALRLDAAFCVHDGDIMKVIHIDGKEYEFGSEAHLTKLDEQHRTQVTKLDEQHRTEVAKREAEHQKALGELKRQFDETTGRLDAAEKDNSKLKTELEALRDPKALSERVDARVNLVLQARSLLGDEPKLDAMSDRDIMVEVIRADDREFAADGKSDDYVRGVFERALRSAARAGGIDAALRAAEGVRRADAVDDVTRARDENRKRNAEAWKQPLAFSKDQSRG